MPATLIGWREWVRLPDLQSAPMKAKMDTGAKTSALHAYDMRLTAAGSSRFVEFALDPDEDSQLTMPVKEVRAITSSNGFTEERPVICTSLVIAGEQRMIEITLTRRDQLGHNLLVGRSALRGLVIDPTATFLAGASND